MAKFTDFPKSQPIEISILNIFNRIEFTGLKVSADLNVALMNDGSNEGLMSIGHKKRSSNGFSRGFPGPEGSLEEQASTPNEVTLVELKARRHLGSKRNFDIHATSSDLESKVDLLIDGVAHCFPDEDLYFTTDQEIYPRVEIDLKMTRIVTGITIFFRADALAPEINGNEGI